MAAAAVPPLGDLSGRRIVVTGANSGIGLETTRALVAHGAEVVMACRSTEKAEAAAAGLRGAPGGVVVRHLDLADLSSVRRFAGETAGDGALSGVVANAAVMACPLSFTADGLELQMGTNHFGHALLVSLLLPMLEREGRVVVVSSIAARGGKLDAGMQAVDLTAPAPYRAQTVYSNSKQANLLFAQELQRRLRAASSGTAVVAVHPGVSATELFPRQMRDNRMGFLVPLVRPVMGVILQSAAAGALPSLRALSDPALRGGEFLGPRHLGQTRGRPELLELYRQGADNAAASRLFDLTEEVLGTGLVAP